MTIRYGARSQDELEAAAAKGASVAAWSTSLSAIYETDADAVAEVLPPPLEPSPRPRVRVSVATVDLGPHMPEFGAGTFAVEAMHAGCVGYYPLLMPMSSEMAVVGGREKFGEPKKLAEISVTRDGAHISGSVARMGVTIIELAGTVGEAFEPEAGSERTDFYFKFLPAPDGKGFDSEPSLVYCHRTETARSAARVNGDVLLRESRFDPVADLEVHRVIEMSISERQAEQRGEIVATVPADWILPYVHQRYDDQIAARSVAEDK